MTDRQVNVTGAAGPKGSTIAAAQGVRDLVGRKRLKPLMVRKDGPGLIFLAGHCALLGLTGALLWSSLGTSWVVVATVLHGIVIVHFFAPFHECAHGTTFKSDWLNRALGWLTGLVLMLPPRAFKYMHADHHTHTQDIRRDPQMIAMGERLPGYLYYASSIPYHLANLQALISHPFDRLTEPEARAVPAHERAAVQREALLFWGIYLLLAAGSLWFQSWAVVVYWLIPRVAAEPVMRLIRMSEHVACPQVPDMLHNSRTVKCVAPVRWLAWNMPYHTAHHAVPSVPFHAVPKLNAILEPYASEVRNGYPDAIRFQIRNALKGGTPLTSRDPA